MTHSRRIPIAAAILSVLSVAGVEGQNGPQQEARTKNPKAHSVEGEDRSSLAERRGEALILLQSVEREKRLQAIELYEKVARDAKEDFSAPTHPDGHDEIILSLRDLAAAYSIVGRFPDAVRTQTEAYRFCRQLYPDRKSSAGVVLTAHSLLRLALYHRQNRNREKFAEFLDNAEEYIRGASMEPSFEAAYVQMELALELTEVGKIESARELCVGAATIATRLRTGELTAGQKNDVVALYTFCASTLYDIADLTEARRYARKAVTLGDSLPEDLVRHNLAGALRCLGACHSELGEYDQAIAVLKRAHKIYEALWPDYAGQIAIQIASAYRRSRRFDDARRWLDIARKVVSTENSISYLYEKAALETAFHNYDEALESHRRALQLLERRPEAFRERWNIRSAMAELEMVRGDNPAAAALLRQVWQAKTTYFHRILPTASEASALSYMRYYWRTTELYLEASRAMTEPGQVERQYELVS